MVPVDNPRSPYPDGWLRPTRPTPSRAGVYKALYKCCNANAGHDQCLHVGGLDAFKSGQVAMQMNWFAFSRPLQGPECRRRQDRLLRQSAEKLHATQLGASVCRRILFRPQGTTPSTTSKWFADPRYSRNGGARRLFGHKAVVTRRVSEEAPFAPTS